MTSIKFREFAEKIDPKKIIIITASLHIKELERTNLLNRYIQNYLFLKKKGFNIVARSVGYPPLINKIKYYNNYFKEKGINLKWDPFIGTFKGKTYPDSYIEKEFKIMDVGKKNVKRFFQKGKFCNAGYNIGDVKPNGDINYCGKIHKSIGNIYHTIKFNNKLIQCPFKKCFCPYNLYDIPLFKKAVNETNLVVSNLLFFKKYLLIEYLRKIIISLIKYQNIRHSFSFLTKNKLFCALVFNKYY